jgi:hypothetical protein
MRTLQKWDYPSESYKDYNIPNEWKLGLFTRDMDALINCCQCGAEIKYGDGYTSKEVHTEFGLGYSVCDNCYDQEHSRERESKGE